MKINTKIDTLLGIDYFSNKIAVDRYKEYSEIVHLQEKSDRALIERRKELLDLKTAFEEAVKKIKNLAT